jgi:hypothetical protein
VLCCWFIEFILQWNVNNTHPLKTMHKQTLLLLTISSGPAAAASADLPLEEPVIKLSSSSLHPNSQTITHGSRLYMRPLLSMVTKYYLKMHKAVEEQFPVVMVTLSE